VRIAVERAGRLGIAGRRACHDTGGVDAPDRHPGVDRVVAREARAGDERLEAAALAAVALGAWPLAVVGPRQRVVPHSPAIAFGPVSTAPFTTTPPPQPVPMITPNTTDAPAAAPSLASESAKQLASLARRTGRSSRASTSWCSRRPFSHVELAFFTTPVAGEIVPGMPMPTVQACPIACSASATSAAMTCTVAS
jgi:hypothetical protein